MRSKRDTSLAGPVTCTNRSLASGLNALSRSLRLRSVMPSENIFSTIRSEKLEASGAGELLETIFGIKMKIEQILQKLDSVKKAGQGYRAKCPVHGSKGQTLSITQKEGDYIVANCFSCGANGPELVEAIGLPVSILFPDDGYIPPVITKKMRSENIFDGIVQQMSDQANSLEDARLVRKAKERSQGFELKAKQAEVEFAPESHPALKPFETRFDTAIKKSPALRDEIVEGHWDGIAQRNEMWLKNQ